MAESKQHWLDRNRPPRVQITYDVEIGDAIVKKELPFVVGIMADLGGRANGKPVANPKPLRDRKFVEIDRDNFNEVMKAIKPSVKTTVSVDVNGKATPLAVDIAFEHIDELAPVAILKKIEPMAKLFEARQRLADLLTKLDGNEKLEDQLLNILKESGKADKIKAEGALIAAKREELTKGPDAKQDGKLKADDGGKDDAK